MRNTILVQSKNLQKMLGIQRISKPFPIKNNDVITTKPSTSKTIFQYTFIKTLTYNTTTLNEKRPIATTHNQNPPISSEFPSPNFPLHTHTHDRRFYKRYPIGPSKFGCGKRFWNLRVHVCLRLCPISKQKLVYLSVNPLDAVELCPGLARGGKQSLGSSEAMIKSCK